MFSTNDKRFANVKENIYGFKMLHMTTKLNKLSEIYLVKS